VRAGQTEGSVDLARLAGLKPAGVICEIMKDDGTMARQPDLMRFAKKHKLKVVTNADLIQYRLNYDSLVYKAASAPLPTRVGGEFQAIVYNTHVDDNEHLALIKGNISPKEETLVRVHTKYVPAMFLALSCLTRRCHSALHGDHRQSRQRGNFIFAAEAKSASSNDGGLPESRR
jgi:3,4-dihydroxy 2-butanone 4-phosphate synthase/GTP cyclohydrolase II